MKKGQLSVSMLALSAMALGGLPLEDHEVAEEREPTLPTQIELEWMQTLNSYRQAQWERRFRLGLTAEQKLYVDEQVRGML